MKISTVNNYQQYTKTNSQPKNNNVSFGVIRDSAKPLLKEMGFGFFNRNYYALHAKEIVFWGEGDKLKCKLNYSQEQYDNQWAAIDMFRSILEEQSNVIPNRDVLEKVMSAFEGIFPPPPPEPPPEENPDHRFYL